MPTIAHTIPSRRPGNIWRYRELIVRLAAREIRLRYRGTFLGIFWSFASPLLMLGIYAFVFTTLFHPAWSSNGQDKTPYWMKLLAGLIPFMIFAEVVAKSPNQVRIVPNYVKKVVFPLEVLGVVAVLTAVIHSLISVGLLIGASAIFLKTVSWQICFLPLAYLPLVLLCLGLNWFLSSLGMYIRDMAEAVGPAIQMLNFLSPIFYPLAAAPESARVWLRLNPLTNIIIAFRQSLLGDEAFAWGPWLDVTIASGILAIVGYVWFVKTKRGFADVI